MPLATTSIKQLSLDEAERYLAGGDAYIDLRMVVDYLDVHVPGSLCLQYEYGPGMPSRARDCIPLHVGFVLLDHGVCDMAEVAAALRGKGFAVHGYLPDGLRVWGERYGAPASTEIVEDPTAPEGTLLSVGDPGSTLPPDALYIPLEQLWTRLDEVRDEPVVLIAGRGVRAALAIGMLERAGKNSTTFWRAPRRR